VRYEHVCHEDGPGSFPAALELLGHRLRLNIVVGWYIYAVARRKCGLDEVSLPGERESLEIWIKEVEW
jgi:hypothetical protein